MKRAEMGLSGLIVVLALPVNLTGLFFPSIRRDPPVLVPQNLGTDLVSLLVARPDGRSRVVPADEERERALLCFPLVSAAAFGALAYAA